MLLIKDHHIADDIWVHIPDTEATQAGNITVSLARFQAERDALLARGEPLGVRLLPEDDPFDLASDLAPDLASLSLIEISFPKYTDGRGYSQAQLLRRRLGYRGELRAVGDVLRDQLLIMLRSGFNAFCIQNTDLAGFQAALSEYSHAYQPDARPDAFSIFERRHEGT